MTMTWQPIKTAPKDGKLWEVSINGIIRVNNKIKKSHLSSKGYEKICIGNKTIFVHRIIAMTFVSNPNNFIEVNHKNGIKTDNRADNLEWCTNSENHIHASKNGLNKLHLHRVAYSGEENVKGSINLFSLSSSLKI